MSGVDEPSYLAACLGKLDHGEPELASALIARGAERLNANGRGANTRVFKLFGQLCALETTLLRASTTLGIDRRSTSARGLFTFTRKSLLDEYQGLWAALADSAKAFAAVGSAMLPMIEAAAALVSTRTRVASHYAKLGGAFGGGLPPPMDAVDDIASSAQASAGMLEPHRLLLPQICEDIASELGLLRRLLRLRTTLGRCEPLESALLARESQRALIMWRSRAIKRALQDLPTLERDAQGVDVELFQICMNSLPDPPIPTLSRDQMFGLRCESVTRDFQMDNGLPVDGKVNVATWKELFATLTEQWPRPHWGTMHPKTASAASYVAQIASDAATHGGPVPATDGSGPWAAGSLQRGPFLPPAALWLHDLWLRLCEKMSLYFDEMRRLGRQHLLPAITAPLERSSSGHSNSSKHAMSQPSSPQSASIRSGAPRLSTSTVPSTSMAGSSENDDTIPSLDRKESTADQPDGSGHRIGAVTSLPSVHPRDFAEGEAKHAAISAHTLGMQDRDSPEERPGTPERTGGLKQASRSQLVWEAPSRFEHRIMELCGGSVIPRQGRAQSSSSLADQEWTIGAMASGLTMQAEGERGAALSTDRPLNSNPILDARHAFAVFFIIDSNAAGLQQKPVGEMVSDGRASARTPFGGFSCRQDVGDQPARPHASGLAQWPLVCSFPRSSVVVSAAQLHMPTIAMLLMQRERQAAAIPRWHYTAQSFCEPDLPAHAEQQKSGARGCTYWMIGVEECMTMVVLYPGRHRCDARHCGHKDCHGHPEASAEAREGVELLASRLWLMPEMTQVTAALVPDAA